MCMNPELKAKLEADYKVVGESITAESKRMHVAGEHNITDHYRDLVKQEREIQKQIEAIPHKFSVGDGAHTSNNGDCYPYEVVEVSKSGKSIKVVNMGHRAVKPADGSELQCGHQSWQVYSLGEYVPGETGTETYTLRKNGRWIREGNSQNAYWCGIHPGAYYSYNWEF